jgi:TRAP-type C4-dicarboxylate transport system substrate-binding protein
MNQLRIASLSAAAALGGCLLVASAQAQTMLRFNNWLPPTHSHLVGVINPWIEQVEEATGGRVQIELTDSSLGAPPRQFDLVAEGIVDVALGIVGYTPGRFKVMHITDLPLISDSGEARSVATWRVYNEHLKPVGEFDDVVLMSVYASTPGSILTRDDPITDIESYAGMKLRTGGGMMEDINQALGGVNVSAPAGQIYELVSSGVADGALMGGEGYDSFKLEGLINYATVVPGGLYSAGWYIIMNKDAWAKISPEDQEAIMSVSGEQLARLAGAAFDAAEEAGQANWEKDGVQVTVADEKFMEEVRARAQPLLDGWVAAANAEGVDGEAAFAMYREEVKKFEMENN